MKKLLFTLMAVLAGMAASAQWSADPINGVNVWSGNNTNYGYTVLTNAQGVTYAYFHGVSMNGMQYPMYVQVVDKNGYKLIDGDGLLLSNEANISWTKVNTDMTIDVNGNAIVSVSDYRLGDESYTIYKVGSDGQLIWGDKTLNSGESPGSSACMSICPTSDGGAIFAYETYSDETSLIHVEKLDVDGNSVWQQVLEGEETYGYPYLVDAGENQAFLFYAQGNNQIVKVRLLDFDGSSVWGEDVTIYSGGFGSTPLHVQFTTSKALDGALAAWMCGDAMTGTYENRMAYILKDDGSFSFSDGEGGTIISNESYFSRMVPSTYYDEGDNAIYAVYKQFDQNYQSNCGIFMQKLSPEGELLWGANGKAVIDMQIDEGEIIDYDNIYQLMNISVRDAGDGKIAVFWQQLKGANAYSGAVESMIVLYDANGNMIQNPVNFTTSAATKNKLKISELINGDHYIVSWSESIDDSDKQAVQVMRVNLDGSTTNIISPKDGTAKETTRKEIFNVTGGRLAAMQKGVNVVRSINADGTSNTQKIIIK